MARVGTARNKILSAALAVIREKGYSATTVEELCAKAGVTKGAFFHHFASKEELAVAAARHWAETTGAFFAGAPYHAHDDPLQRFLGYLAFRRQILVGELPEFSCLAGTMVQEVFATHPAIREACGAAICDHAETLVRDIEEAKAFHGIEAEWSARSLALFTQTVLQGAFVLAKAKGGPEVAVASIDHLINYISMLFSTAERPETDTQRRADRA
ncbi:MAG: TetR family transcriptional regulator [Rhizobiales bacterium]|nr:TetR family transcriptional regulator [Hyphomicrobiales bacterium]